MRLTKRELSDLSQFREVSKSAAFALSTRRSPTKTRHGFESRGREKMLRKRPASRRLCTTHRFLMMISELQHAKHNAPPQSNMPNGNSEFSVRRRVKDLSVPITPW